MPSPCRWPTEGRLGPRAWWSGPPTPPRTPWPWRRRTSVELARKDPAAAGRVRLSEGRWFDALPPELAGTVDLVVSNPPYVSEAEFPGLDPTVRDWEPAPGPGGGDGLARRGRHGRHRGRDRRRVPVVAARRACWWWRSTRPRRTPPSRWPAGPGSPEPHRARTWPGGSAWWWPGGDGRAGTAGRRSRVAGPGGRGPPGGCRGGHTHRHRLRAGRRPVAARRRWHGSSPSRSGRRTWPSRCWWPAGSRSRLVAGPLDGAAEHLADRYWPGPLTLVVPRRRSFTADLGGPPSARRTVGVRWPDHPVVQALCRELGPMAVTSANRHGGPPATRARRWPRSSPVSDGLAVILDGGRCDGTPSTVVECRGPGDPVPAPGGDPLGRAPGDGHGAVRPE